MQTDRIWGYLIQILQDLEDLQEWGMLCKQHWVLIRSNNSKILNWVSFHGIVLLCVETGKAKSVPQESLCFQASEASISKMQTYSCPKAYFSVLVTETVQTL